ncbi:MAG: efflux RND transporter periplasmic adaptor subunit [Armatimonadota bacterium]
MNRWAIAAIGVLVLLALLVGVGIGRRMSNSGRLEETKHEARKQTHEREERHSEITLTKEGEKLAGIKIVPVGYGEITQTLDVTGEVQPDTNKLVQVGSFVSGRVSQIFVNVGDEVKTGQILALLDSTEVAQAQAAYAQALTKLEAAKKRWENLKRLAKEGAFTQRPPITGLRGVG